MLLIYLTIYYLSINWLLIITVESSLTHMAMIFRISSPTELFTRALATRGLYLLNPSFRNHDGSKALLSTSSNVELWHRRLGHPSRDMMVHLKSQNKIQLVGDSSRLDCHACYCGKSHKLPFHASDHNSINAFDLVHADVWGPSPIASFTGFRYYILLIDDYTRYSWLIPIHLKSDVPEKINEFRRFVLNYFQSNIKQ